MIYTTTIDTPLGEMTAAAKEEALIGLWFVGQKHYPGETGRWNDAPGYTVFEALRRYLAEYFAGNAGVPDLPLDPQGSPFQQAVWDILLEIPRGEVTTYGQIGEIIARGRGLASMSAQAVGGAVGRNPISILIPCHRVVGSDGRLTGYAGGLDRKEALLRIESVDPGKIDPGAWTLSSAIKAG